MVEETISFRGRNYKWDFVSKGTGGYRDLRDGQFTTEILPQFAHLIIREFGAP